MARPQKVWWNKQKKAWYATIGGRKVRVADGDQSEEQAKEAWHELHAKDIAVDLKDLNPVAVIFELYLDYLADRKAVSYVNARAILQSFKNFHPNLKVHELTAVEVQRWLYYRKGWHESMRSLAIRTVLAALNHAASPEVKVITRNPIAGMKRPATRSRGAESLVDPTDHATLCRRANGPLRDVLEALYLTGTRPSVIRRIEASDCHFDAKTVRVEKSKVAGRPLVVPMPDSVRPLLERLCREHPKGPIFRNNRGGPWTKDSLEKAFGNLKGSIRESGIALAGNPILYGYRHTVATELLEAGVSDAKVAAMLGHSSTTMLHHHYSHLTAKSRALADEMGDALKRDAERA